MAEAGSRKHVAVFVRPSKVAARLTGLVDDERVSFPADGVLVHWPNRRDPSEMQLKTYFERLPRASYPAVDSDRLWQLAHGGKRPTWDLLATCEVLGKPGLLLVEAKAHKGELFAGDLKELPADASEKKRKNRKGIVATIDDARKILNRLKLGGTFHMHAGRHYQLVNRLATATLLASEGVHVVLLYLGFAGDTHFKGDYLRDDGHWQRLMGTYLDGIVPLWFPGMVVRIGKGSVLMLVRSLDVRSLHGGYQ